MYTVCLRISGSLLVMFKVNGALQRRSMDFCVACACNWLGAPKWPVKGMCLLSPSPYRCVYIHLCYYRRETSNCHVVNNLLTGICILGRDDIASALSLRHKNISYDLPSFTVV